MGWRIWVVLAMAASAGAQTPMSVRILLGVTDTQTTSWDGRAEAQGGRIASLEPWRFEGSDALTGTVWRISTHPMRRFNGAGQPPMVANGIVVNLNDAAGTSLHVITSQGNFDLNLDELEYGQWTSRLDGRVLADRIPPTRRITETPEEEDFPSAAADRAGNIWVAAVVFHHSPHYEDLRTALTTPLTDFAPLKQPTGGDQIVVRRIAGGTAGPPIEITPAGLDLYHSAVAIDGQQRVWVLWSQNDRGNFDVYARPIVNGRLGREVQISREPGSDMDAVAATDSRGNVWVAWQGWRNGRASIYAAMQNGLGFNAPVKLSQSAGNEWNPAIAASREGRVTVAWDSYRNGNYDIYARTAASEKSWGPEFAIAATPRYEAYPSLAYDGAGRLWAAYEEGGSGWGKDFGAYDTQGIALYQGRAIRLVAFEPGGARVETQEPLGGVLPGVPNVHVNRPGVQSEAEEFDSDPARVRGRPASQMTPEVRASRNNYPRLAIDGSGRVWLAFRSAHPIWWDGMGTVWTEHLVSYDGSHWTPSIYLHHTDNLLDNRPALAPTGGGLMVIGSADGRRQFRPIAERDVLNNDLWASEVSLGPAGRMALKPAAASRTAIPDFRAETAAIERIRSYRAPEPAPMIVRGEFHRHSEISMDGGNDGSLLDQWRYILDAGALDWVGCCDHDNGAGREYTWWLEQKYTDLFYAPGVFVPMFAYERSVAYPEGHRNVIFAQRGIRVLPRLPLSKEDAPGPAADTQMLYAYLRYFGGIVASHTSATGMGTDWRDNDPNLEPAVEIYQGDRQNYEMPDAPRSISQPDSIGGWRPKGFVNLALEKGYKLGFEASSDHISTHISYCNIYVKERSREGVLEGLKQRHVYAATDNILADVRSGVHMMGDAFQSATPPSLQVKLMGTAKFSQVHIVKDNAYVYATQPNSAEVQFSWMDNAATPGKTSYYYVRAEQEDGQIVWVSPMWITYTAGK